MAILNDLIKETSFRRFYLRWLAACWLPAFVVVLPFAAGAIALWFKFWWLFQWLFFAKGMASALLWLLVGIGQWWFMRSYFLHHKRWAATAMLGGLVASFILFFLGGFTFVPSTGIFFYPLLWAVSAATGPMDPTPWLMAAGGAGFGVVLAAPLSLLVASSFRPRMIWTLQLTLASAAIFASLWPLYDILMWSYSMLRFPPRITPLVVFGGTIGASTGVLLVGWMLWSAAAGMALWWMRRLQVRRDLAEVQRVFE